MATRNNHVNRPTECPFGSEDLTRWGARLEEMLEQFGDFHDQAGAHTDPLVAFASGFCEFDANTEELILKEGHGVLFVHRDSRGRYAIGFGVSANVEVTPTSGTAMVSYQRLRGLGAFSTVVEFRVRRVSFEVTQGTDQLTVSEGSWVKVNLDTEARDVGSNFDSGTNYDFTAPADGVYSFFGQVTLFDDYIVSTPTVTGRCGVSIGGATPQLSGAVITGQSTAGERISPVVSGSLFMRANDVATLVINGTALGNLDIESGILIGLGTSGDVLVDMDFSFIASRATDF